MKPIYENIDVAVGTSLKIQTFTHSQTCELANWHIHPEYEMVYVKNGAGTLRIDSKTIPYSDGALLLLGPNIPHADFGNKEHSDNLEVVVQFGKEFLDGKLAVFPEFRKIKKLILESKRAIMFDPDVKVKLSPAFESFDRLNSTQRLIHFISILELLSNTTKYSTLLDSTSPTSNKTSDVNRLELVFEYVNGHYGESISAQGMASQVGLTTNSFCRFFKKMTGQSFIQFLNEFRTRKAMELFDRTELSISEVLYRCGYTDPSYFTKQFKKHQGATPTAYTQLLASTSVETLP